MLNWSNYGDIYGDINEEIEFQSTQNPYYGGEVDDGPIQIKTVQNPYYNGEIWNKYDDQLLTN